MKKIILKLAFVLIMATTLGCQKADLSVIENLRDNEIGIVGHGGMGFPSPQVNLPSNSYESIIKAVEGYQVDAVEVDVQLSADGVLFLYHDSRLQTLTDCLGCLYEKKSEVLKECKYVSGFNAQHFNNQKLVELETVIERLSLRIPKPKLFLDLKTSPDCAQTFDRNSFEVSYVAGLKAIFTKYNCQDWVIVESASFSFLKKVQEEIPGVLLNYATLINESNIELAIENEFFGLSTGFESVSKETIRLAHEKGLFITLGILRIRKDAIEMIEKSPDFIYTDNIPLLQSILN